MTAIPALETATIFLNSIHHSISSFAMPAFIAIAMLCSNVVGCTKLNVMAFIGLFILILGVSAETNNLPKSIFTKDKLPSGLQKPRFRYPSTSAPRIKLSDTPECTDDIRRICPASILNNNFAVLDCLQNDKVRFVFSICCR